MRKRHSESRLAPYVKGYCAGLAATVAVAASGALAMVIFGADSGIAWLPAVIAAASGSFVFGRTAGRLRRRDGLRTGALCAAVYAAPLFLAGALFGKVGGALLLVKLALCAGFSAAGAVSGVNSPERE